PVYAIKHRKIAATRGQKKATMAIGHKILIAAYHVLRDKVPWAINPQDPQVTYLRRMKKIERLENQLKQLKQTS
ncbi:MAG: hypothetical protein KDC49_03510, partial [Saprospiraceae bacterium]|nr:hypothetical protein [Saprospiraceae bacterium]